MYDNIDSHHSDDPIKRFMSDYGKWVLVGLAVFSALGLALSMAFTVNTDCKAVIFRFGQFNRVVGPGLNFKAPAGVEKAVHVSTEKVFREVFGFRSDKNVTVPAESLMITGDLSVAALQWIVQYRVDDPVAYLVNIRRPRELLRDMSEYAARLAIGDLSLNEVLRNRDQYRADFQQLLQKELSEVDSGMKIVAIEINDANVPHEVKASYNAVNEAQQERERMIYAANQVYNDKIPEAKGKAKAIVDNAKGEAAEIVNAAKGRVSRFIQQREEYNKAKAVTATRMYLDTMSDVLKDVNIVIVDGEMDNVLPMLNMTKGGK